MNDGDNERMHAYMTVMQHLFLVYSRFQKPVTSASHSVTGRSVVVCLLLALHTSEKEAGEVASPATWSFLRVWHRARYSNSETDKFWKMRRRRENMSGLSIVSCTVPIRDR